MAVRGSQLHTSALCCCLLVCMVTMTMCLPMRYVIDQAMNRMGLQQKHRRYKRGVIKSACVQPDNLEAMFVAINSGLDRTQFLRATVNGQGITVPARETAKVIGSDPNENTTCPSFLTHNGDAPLAHRTICPYYFELVRLPDGYYPPILKRALCKCRQCLENNAYGCETVPATIAVLKPVGCWQGLQKYEEHLLQVPTACVCAVSGTKIQTLESVASADWGVQK